MRYFTYGVGAVLVKELAIAGAVDDILHDGRDIIHIRLITGATLMIYLIDSTIPLYEIRNIVTQNTAQGDSTLFLLWADMLLPDHGRLVELEDWHHGLMALQGGKIYAYKTHMQHLFLFPVTFEPMPYSVFRRVEYGDPFDVGAIRCYSVTVNVDGLQGTFGVAAFDGDPEAYHRQRAEQVEIPVVPARLSAYYAALGLEIGADRATVKAAYREIARQIHPDRNLHDEDANRKMQALNFAYAVILKDLDAHGNG